MRQTALLGQDQPRPWRSRSTMDGTILSRRNLQDDDGGACVGRVGRSAPALIDVRVAVRGKADDDARQEAGQVGQTPMGLSTPMANTTPSARTAKMAVVARVPVQGAPGSLLPRCARKHADDGGHARGAKQAGTARKPVVAIESERDTTATTLPRANKDVGAGHVTHVVTDVIGDHRRVTRSSSASRTDQVHQVGADVAVW